MAMFDQWNWWLPGWLARILPSVDFEKPLPKVDLGDLVIIPDDISALVAPTPTCGWWSRTPPGCATWRPMPSASPTRWPSAAAGRATSPGRCRAATMPPRPAHPPARIGASIGQPTERRPLRSYRVSRATGPRPIHPVTMWRGRLSVALDALESEPDITDTGVERLSPVETTNVQLPTGDRLQIPTGAETLRLKSYLIMCRNSRSDYAEFADLVDCMDTPTAAVVLAGIDRYYGSGESERQWVATNWCAGSPIRDPPTSTTTATVGPGRRRPTNGRGSDSVAWRWQWRSWRRRGDGDSATTPRSLIPIRHVSSVRRPSRRVLADGVDPLRAGDRRRHRLAAHRGGHQAGPVRPHRPPGRRGAGALPAVRNLQGAHRGAGPGPQPPGGQRTGGGGPTRGCCWTAPVWASRNSLRASACCPTT